jgi:hypothetical protein
VHVVEDGFPVTVGSVEEAEVVNDESLSNRLVVLFVVLAGNEVTQSACAIPAAPSAMGNATSSWILNVRVITTSPPLTGPRTM